MLGEMIQAGFSPLDLDEMDTGEITSWRAVMGAYAEAVEGVGKRR